MIGFAPGKRVQLLEDLLERRGRRVGTHRGRHAPDASLAAEVERRTGAIGVAMILAQVLVQTAEKVLAQQVVADQSGKVAGVAAVAPVPTHADHALHRPRLIHQVNHLLRRLHIGGGPGARSGILPFPSPQGLLQLLCEIIRIDVACDDQGGPLGAEACLRGKPSRPPGSGSSPIPDSLPAGLP